MGKTARREVWSQQMTGPAPVPDEAHRRERNLLDRIVPGNRELSHPEDDGAEDGADGGGNQHQPRTAVHTSSNQPYELDHQDGAHHSPPAPTPSLAPPPTLPHQLEKALPLPPSTHLRLRSSLAPSSRLTHPIPSFTTQSSPTKRKQVRIWQDDGEKVPGVGSDKGSPQAKRTDDSERPDGRDKRRRVKVSPSLGLSSASSVVGRGRMGAEEAEARAADATRLAQGAIERCIKYPYRHTDSPRAKTLNPPNQQPSPIYHSYHDPPAPRNQLPTPRGVPLSSPADVKPGAFLFPNVLPFLAPGRRGAWLIPLSGPLPWTQGKPTPPAWYATPPTPVVSSSGTHLLVPEVDALPSSSPALAPSSGTLPSSSTLATAPAPIRRRPRTVAWTDARLRALWHFLGRLHETGKMGPVWAECLTVMQSGGLMPDHIRVHAMAHLALALRHWLGLVDVKSTKGEVGEGAEDEERFLDRVRLVWVDEGGRAVLVA